MSRDKGKRGERNCLIVTLPYPPTVNHYWLIGRGRMYLSPAGRQYRRQVEAILFGSPTITGEVTVTVAVYPPDRRKRDLDNVLKALLDGLGHGGVYDDDSQVAVLRVIRCEPDPPGRVEVSIGSYQGAA
jgi:crossover junction endodeoxyribonuclease RusA